MVWGNTNKKANATPPPPRSCGCYLQLWPPGPEFQTLWWPSRGGRATLWGVVAGGATVHHGTRWLAHQELQLSTCLYKTKTERNNYNSSTSSNLLFIKFWVWTDDNRSDYRYVLHMFLCFSPNEKGLLGFHNQSCLKAFDANCLQEH